MLCISRQVLPSLVLVALTSAPAGVPLWPRAKAPRDSCESSPDLAATLHSVHAGDRTGKHFVTVALALQNSSRDSLTLGYVTSALVVTDTIGRLLALSGRALGMQPIPGTQFNAGLTLASGARDSLLLDFQWESRNAPAVTPLGLRVVVSQVVPSSGRRMQVCPQWQLQFRRLVEGEAGVGGPAVPAGVSLGARLQGSPARATRASHGATGESDSSRQGMLDAARKLLQIIPKKP